MTETPVHTLPKKADSDQHARFCALVEPHIEAVGRFVHALTRNREEARDIVGDVLLRAFEKLDTLKHEQASASWLFSIARNIVYERKRRTKFWGIFDETKAIERPSDAALPDVSADVALLHEALAKLSAAQREAITLFEIAGLSLEEIRQIQGGTVSGVKSRVTRSREQLKKCLTNDE
ncbi:MAG: sigma-70 family RNA polymerase sigma factor [Candidatus Kapaibacterium sp.]|nr:MAG: sigma-70 family RNA polymerase sigma factor [Candidatus Kapabacteria bacterium]